MSIYNYEILNPITTKHKPYIDINGYFIVPNINRGYKYFMQCRKYNDILDVYEYFILISNTKFDEHCLSCRDNYYGKLKLSLNKELDNHVRNEIKYKGYVNFTYLETCNNYDVYILE